MFNTLWNPFSGEHTPVSIQDPANELLAAERTLITPDISNKAEYLNILKQVPGVDPVIAFASGQYEKMPKTGMIIHAIVVPGYSGYINIFHYLEGRIKVRDVKPTELCLSHAGFQKSHYNIAYDNPQDNRGHTSGVYKSKDFTTLNNGGILIDNKDPLKISTSTELSGAMWLRWDDLDNEQARKYGGLYPAVELNRAVAKREELGSVLTYLGAGMGLEGPDIDILLQTVNDKMPHSRSDLGRLSLIH